MRSEQNTPSPVTSIVPSVPATTVTPDDLRRPRRGRLLQHAFGTAAHRDPDDEGVLRAAAAGAHGRQRRADRRDLTEPGAELVDDVRTRRAEPTAAPLLVEPPPRNGRGGVGDERHVLHQREGPRFADRARRDRPRHERPIGRPAELVPDEMRHPRPFRGREHELGLRRVERERLLAQHVRDPRRTPRSRARRAYRAAWRS